MLGLHPLGWRKKRRLCVSPWLMSWVVSWLVSCLVKPQRRVCLSDTARRSDPGLAWMGCKGLGMTRTMLATCGNPLLPCLALCFLQSCLEPEGNPAQPAKTACHQQPARPLGFSVPCTIGHRACTFLPVSTSATVGRLPSTATHGEPLFLSTASHRRGSGALTPSGCSLVFRNSGLGDGGSG